MKVQPRRRFIKQSTIVALGSPFLSSAIPNGNKSISCLDIEAHFQKIGHWINWKKTTDTFKIGDPTKKVKKIAVAWKANLAAVEKAIALDADLFISHESICANANNSFMGPEKKFAMPTELPKFEMIEKAGLVVYRCHDLWDSFPEIGIRDTWQRELKMGNNIVADKYPYYITEIEPITVRELAKHILKQIKPLKQNSISVSGNLDKVVSKVGTGTGVNSKPVPLVEIGADVGIMTDDYYLHVRHGEHANELDFPVILVNHTVAEEWGIMNLAAYLKKEFHEIEVHHIPQYCPYKVLT